MIAASYILQNNIHQTTKASLAIRVASLVSTNNVLLIMIYCVMLVYCFSWQEGNKQMKCSELEHIKLLAFLAMTIQASNQQYANIWLETYQLLPLTDDSRQ